MITATSGDKSRPYWKCLGFNQKRQRLVRGTAFFYVIRLADGGKNTLYFITYANETLPLRSLQLACGIGRVDTSIDKVGNCQESH